MGTSVQKFGYSSVREFIQKYIVGRFGEEWSDITTLIDHAIVGNTAYLLIHSIPRNEKFICVVICRKFNQDFSWKYIEDSCEPYYFECPERLLKQTSSTSEGALRWYAACSELRNHKKELKVTWGKVKTKLTENDVIKTENYGDLVFKYFLKENSFIAKSVNKNQNFKYNGLKGITIEEWQNFLKDH